MTKRRTVDEKLIALFPHVFSRRGEDNNDDLNRNWLGLELHNDQIRVLGTHWSMVFLLNKQDGEAQNIGRGIGMNVLHEQAEATDIPDGPQSLHEPSMLRLDLRDVWRSTLVDGKATRLSLLAADVASQFPFNKTPSNPVLDQTRSTGVIARPFGVFPRNTDFGNDTDAQTGSVYHPAVQMVTGELWVRPTPTYLGNLRRTFGLGPATEIDNHNHIVLLPDGFALAGSLRPPLGDARLSGWFKVTTANGAPDGTPVLRLWSTPDRPIPDAWIAALAELGDVLNEAGNDTSEDNAEWLSIAPDRLLSPDAVFWPCDVTKGILLRRTEGDTAALWLDAGLSVAFTSPAGNRLSVETGAFRIAGTGDTLTITTVKRPQESNPFGPPVDAIYAYSRDADPLEIVTFGKTSAGENTADTIEPMTLAVPMLSNAARLRDAMGFDEPPLPRAGHSTNGQLWLFTPLDRGWLHWPFPNVTTALLDPIIKAVAKEDLPERIEPSQTAGFWRFKPAPGRRERPWSLTLSDARGIDLTLNLTRNAATNLWRLTSAKATLFDLSLGLENALPATAFAQTDTNLLPTSADRALRQTGLSMVTPDLLIGTEAQAWFWQTDESNRLRVEATIPALTISRANTSAVTDPEAEPVPESGPDLEPAPDIIAEALTPDETLLPEAEELTLTVDWPDGGADAGLNPFSAPKRNLMPWLWLRQGTLPTLQTMPLAVTGDAGVAPSSSRELAPFRFKPSTARPHTLTFKPAFATRTSTVSLDYAIGEWTRPGVKTTWDGELGMTLPTLPSVTLFPGDDTARSVTVDLPPWSNNATASDSLPAPTQVDLRHDIALTDEGAALASLPPPPEKKDTDDSGAVPAVRPSRTFAKLGYNAPGHEDDQTDGTSWLPVWVDRARAQALTATHARRSIVMDTVDPASNDDEDTRAKSTELRLLDDERYAVTDLEVDLSITTDDGLPTLTTLGSWNVAKKASEEEGKNFSFFFKGLPATTDLTGFTGTLPRGDGIAQLERSTLDAQRGDAPLTDQTGATTKDAKGTRGDLQFKTVELARPDGTRTLRLVTTPKALDIPGTGLRVFLRDIPFESTTADLTDAWFDADLGFDAAANALLPDNQHQHAFGWSLAQSAGNPNQIITGPFIFEPLALTRATLNGDALEKLTFKGLLSLPLQHDTEGLRRVASPGEATLTLNVADAYWTINSKGIDLPLADPLIEARQVPRLEIGALTLHSSNDTDISEALIRLTVADQTVRFLLGEATLNEDGLTFSKPSNGPIAEPTGGAAGKAAVVAASDTETARFDAIKITLPVPRYDDGTLTVSQMNAIAALTAKITPAPDCTLNLELPFDLRRLTLDTDGTHTPDVSLTMGELTFNLAITRLRLVETNLGLDFSGEGNTTILGGLTVDGNSLSGAALLSLGHVTGSQIAIDTSALALTVSARAGNDTQLDLSYDSTSDANNVVATASMVMNSAMTAPTLTVNEAEGVLTATPSDDAAPFHSAEIDVENVRLPVSMLSDVTLALPARVRHKITAPGRNGVSWDSFQIVRLTHSTEFATLLNPDTNPPEISFRPAHENRLDGQIRTHVARSANAMLAGLSSSQITEFPNVFWPENPATIIEFGAHHIISQQPEAAPAHLPLPALGAVRATDTEGQAHIELLNFLAPSSTTDLTFQRPVPAPLAHLTRDQRAQLSQTITLADGRALERRSGIAAVLLNFDPGALDRPLFQGNTSDVQTDTPVWSDTAHPWADAAILRHWLLGDILEGEGPVTLKGVLGLRQSGHTDVQMIQPDLVQDDNSSIFTPEALAIAWSRLGAGVDHLVPAPPQRQDTATTRRIRLTARDRDLGPIATIAQTFAGNDSNQAKKWERGILARLVPQTALGLSLEENTDAGLTRLTHARIAKTARPIAVPSDPPLIQPTAYPNVAQAQRLDSLPGETAHGSDTYYLPVKSGAPALLSEPGLLPASGQTDVRLTASAAEAGYALPHSEHRVLHDGTGPWLSERQVAIPRAFREVGKTGRQPITFALPPRTNQPPPRALSPVPAAPVPPVDKSLFEGQRGLLPSQSATRYIGARSGVLALNSLGVDSQDASGNLHQSARALLGQRLPRPVELGVNDRPRASAFEPAHLALSSTPQAILHGPARTQDKRDLLMQQGLDRAPRAAFATLIALTAPDAGILARDWDGTLTLTPLDTFVSQGGEASAETPWEITDAVLRIGAGIYIAQPPEPAQPEEVDADNTPEPLGRLNNKPLILKGFRDPSGRPATEGLRNVPDAAPVTLTLVAKHSGLTRLTVMTLRKGGPAAPLVDMPAFFRFDDPAYNDRLTGLPRLNRIVIAGSANTDLVLLADRKEVRPDDFITAVLVLVPRGDDGGDLDTQFHDDGTSLVINGAPIPLNVTLERRRPNETTVAPLTPLKGIGDLKPIPSSKTAAQLPLLLFGYKTDDAPSIPVLAANDTLTLLITLGPDTDPQPLPLDFDVKDAPAYPVNPSGYGVLRMDGTPLSPKEVSAPLYARGAVPDLLELVDPEEMITGIVRRRAIYYWSSFERRDNDVPPRFALLKSNAIGSSWLPSDTLRDWVALAPDELPEETDST